MTDDGRPGRSCQLSIPLPHSLSTPRRSSADTPADMLLNIDAYEAAARERLERSAYDYYAGGSGDELTLAANRSAYGRYYLRPRALVDASQIDLSTKVLGVPLSFPIMLAPTAFNRMAHPD